MLIGQMHICSAMSLIDELDALGPIRGGAVGVLGATRCSIHSTPKNVY
jgi:hypothetical protein